MNTATTQVAAKCQQPASPHLVSQKLFHHLVSQRLFHPPGQLRLFHHIYYIDYYIGSDMCMQQCACSNTTIFRIPQCACRTAVFPCMPQCGCKNKGLLLLLHNHTLELPPKMRDARALLLLLAVLPSSVTEYNCNSQATFHGNVCSFI